MAKVLPAVSSPPSVTAEHVLLPGLAHLDVQVGGIVEGQHYAAAYMGKSHASQRWASGEIRETGASFVTVLHYDVRPRLAMVALRFVFRVVSTHGGEIRFRCTETSDDLTVSAAAGTVYDSGDLVVDRPDQWTQIEVAILATAGATPRMDLLALQIVDTDLTVAQLP